MDYQLIGKVIGFKGLKGEMKIKALSGFMKERLQENTKVYMIINDQYHTFQVKSYEEKQKTPLLILKGYDNINSVQQFSKQFIYADANDDFLLEENAYHESELIGLKVYQNNELKGVVNDIRNYPKDDYLVINVEDKEVLIPFRDEFIEEMDDEKIVIVDMEGLF